MTALPSAPVADLARSEATRPFWEGLAAGELRLPRCQDCGQVFFFPRPCCPHCWAEAIGWERSAGQGTVYAVSEVHVAFDPTLEVPYLVALVDLDEGVRLPARLDPAGVPYAIGDRVAIAFAEDPAAELPRFAKVPHG
jgi:hypothetical protein